MNTEEKVVQIVSAATKIDVAKIHAQTSFIDDLNLDSLDIAELMMKVEDEFEVEIPEEDAEKIRNINDVVSYIQTKIKQ